MRCAVAGLLAALVLGGCTAFADDTAGVQVAAAFYPLAFVSERVAGEHAEVTDLTTPGTEPHDLELTIEQTAAVARSDVAVHESGLQPAVDDAIAQNAPGEVVDAADVVHLRRFPDGGTDPHFWQDPLLLADVADAVAAALTKVDPDHGADYRANADALRTDLTALDHEYAAGLAGCARDTIVVSHDAFGYLERYGVEVAPVAGLSPDAEPTPKGLADLQRLIRDDGITTVFSERLASPRLTRTLADDMGVATAVLDPLEGLAETGTGEDYLSLMRDNLAALRKADGCP